MCSREISPPLSPLARRVVALLDALGAGRPDGWNGTVGRLVASLRETTGRGVRPATLRAVLDELVAEGVITEYRRGNFKIWRLADVVAAEDREVNGTLSTETIHRGKGEVWRIVDNGANDKEQSPDVYYESGANRALGVGGTAPPVDNGANDEKESREVYLQSGANDIKHTRVDPKTTQSGLRGAFAPPATGGGERPLPNRDQQFRRFQPTNIDPSRTYLSVDDLAHGVARGTRATYDTAPMTHDEVAERKRRLKAQIAALSTPAD